MSDSQDELRTAVRSDVGYFQRGEAGADELTDAIMKRFQKAVTEGRIDEAKLARKQFTEAVFDNEFIIWNGERIAELTEGKK